MSAAVAIAAPCACPHCAAPLDLDALYALIAEDRAARLATLPVTRRAPPPAPDDATMAALYAADRAYLQAVGAVAY